MVRLPSLSDYDTSNFDDYEVMQNGGKQNPAPPPVRRPGLISPAAIGSAECWCGQQMGHDWPGKADDAPHPR